MRFFQLIAWKYELKKLIFNSFYEPIWINQKVMSGNEIFMEIFSHCHGENVLTIWDKARKRHHWWMTYWNYYLLYRGIGIPRSTGAFVAMIPIPRQQSLWKQTNLWREVIQLDNTHVTVLQLISKLIKNIVPLWLPISEYHFNFLNT